MLLVQTLNSVNFRKLTILICHLLIGGKFQSVQILYDSKTLDYTLFRDIKSDCLSEIPWTSIDINQPEIQQWNNKQESDHYIQLILSSNVEFVQNSGARPSNYYRLFVFHSNNNGSSLPEISNRTKLKSKSNTIGLFHDNTGETSAHLLHDDFTIFHKSINLQDLNEPVTSTKVFDRVFGEREKMRKLGTFDPNIHCNGEIKTFTAISAQITRKFLFAQLNMDFVEMGRRHCALENGRYFRHSFHRIYEELIPDFGQINNETGL